MSQSAADTPAPASTVHEFTATGPIDLNIQNLRGDVTLRAEDGTAVRVELIPHGPAGRELVERMGVRFTADRLAVDTPAGEAHRLGGGVGDLFRTFRDGEDGTSWADRLGAGLRSAVRGTEGLFDGIDIVVTVPTLSRAVVNDGIGDVEVHGVLARLEGRTGTGDVTVQRGAEERMRLSTGAGNVTVGPSSGPLAVATGGGDIVLEQAEGETSASTGMGNVTVRRALSGRLTVRSGLGDVVIHVAPGTAAHLDLATGVGDRDVQLTPTDGAGNAERTLEVEARAGKGDLRVLRAAA